MRIVQAEVTRVSIVVVSFNTRDMLVRCVSEATDVPNAEVIVIDNASDDGSADAVAESFPDVCLVRNPENVGFATAVNQGLSIGQGPYYLLLNSDTFDVKDAIIRLSAYLDENPDVGVVAPQLRNLDGSLQPSGRAVPSRWDEMFWNTSLYRLIGRKGSERFFDPSRDYEQTCDVEEVSGACFMTRDEVLDRVGPLDDNFFFCYEDIDFCIRARAAGFRVVYLAYARINHAWGRSAAKAGPSLNLKYLEGYFYYLRKTHGTPFAVLMRSLVWLKTALTIPVALVRRKDGFRTAIDMMSVCFGRRK